MWNNAMWNSGRGIAVLLVGVLALSPLLASSPSHADDAGRGGCTGEVGCGDGVVDPDAGESCDEGSQNADPLSGCEPVDCSCTGNGSCENAASLILTSECNARAEAAIGKVCVDVDFFALRPCKFITSLAVDARCTDAQQSAAVAAVNDCINEILVDTQAVCRSCQDLC